MAVSSPVKGYVTSEWGKLRAGYRHLGMDLGVGGVYGTPVYAMEDGIIEDEVSNRVHDTSSAQTKNKGKRRLLSGRTGNGRKIRSKSNKRRAIYYLHMKPDAALKVGSKVVAGQRIGWIDNSGNTSGAHLHLEVHIDGVSVNPRGAFFAPNKITPGATPVKYAAPVTKPKPAPTAPSKPKTYVTVKKGSKNATVGKVQSALRYKFGYTKQIVDNDFGAQTKANVIHFQKRFKLVADGIAGPITQKKMGL